MITKLQDHQFVADNFVFDMKNNAALQSLVLSSPTKCGSIRSAKQSIASFAIASGSEGELATKLKGPKKKGDLEGPKK